MIEMFTECDEDLQSLAVNNVTSLFWPEDLHFFKDSEKHLLVGYKVKNHKVIVIDCISQCKFNELLLRNDKKAFLKNLDVIGTINLESERCSRSIYYDYALRKPILRKNENLIYFKPPKSWKLEYFSLDPIAINIFWTNNDNKIFNYYDSDKVEYCYKLNYHVPGLERGNDMKEVLRYINLTNYVRSKLNDVENGTLDNICGKIYPIFNFILFFFSFFYNSMMKGICYFAGVILTYPILKFSSRVSSNKLYEESFEDKKKLNYHVWSLSLISHTFHQINFRVKQFYNLPNQFQKLQLSKSESEAIIIKGTKFSPSEYIKFYNTLWLIINDILLGFIVSNIIEENHLLIVATVQKAVEAYESLVAQTITWLMNSPAGFKLNNELASFFGQLILWVLDFWKKTTLKWFIDNFSNVLLFIEIITRYGGLTLFTAVLLDLINLLSLNIHAFYIACTRIYCWQFHILKSLFRLFYGKKYNVLRNRVDSNNYEFDQLMFGIIIFTILLYLLPTVVAFYITFVSARLIALGVCFCLNLNLISFNHLPIVVLLLRLKNKERLPAGITLDHELDNPLNVHFSLLSKCLTFSQIYKSHINSLLNFNLNNYNEVHKIISNNDEAFYDINDITDKWKSVSIVTISKKIVLGEVIKDFDYKKLF